MAAVLANLNNVTERVISILNANPGTFSSTVSGNVGAFPSQNEIDLAILEADEFVVCSGYFQSVNDSLAQPFIVTSAPLADRDNVPWHHGGMKAVELTSATNVFTATATNTLTTSSAHGLVLGDLVSAITTNTLPTGMAVLTNYYAVPLTTTTTKLASSLSNALAGVFVSITNATGSGVNTLLTWITGVEAKNLDDITNAAAVGDTYVGAGAFDFLFKEDTGTIYTTATYCRASYPEYVRTSALQTRQAEEFLDIATAVRILTKNASPAPFAYYESESIRGIQQLVQDGVYSQQADSQQGGEE